MKSFHLVTILGSVILSGALFAAPAVAQDPSCPVVAIKPIKQYLVRSQRRCFNSPRAAENRGNTPYIIPIASPSPSPSATPASFSGNYTGDLAVASDTCDDLAGATIPAVGTFSLTRNVTNEGTVIFGIDSEGHRAAGAAATDSFTIRDTNDFKECPNGEVEVAETFTAVTDQPTMFTVIRVNSVTCPSLGTCTQGWSGTVTKQ